MSIVVGHCYQAFACACLAGFDRSATGKRLGRSLREPFDRRRDIIRARNLLLAILRGGNL